MTILDVSHFQADAGPVDYTAARAAVSGVYIKVTQGINYVDPAWAKHWAGFRGIPRGGYHFCGRMNPLGQVDYQDPTVEALHFASVLTKSLWELRPVVDIEAPGANPNWLKTFLAALRKASGICKLRVYTSHAFITGALAPAAWIDPDTDLWIARYNNSLGFDHPSLKLWQHTDAGQIPGIPGRVDLSTPLHGWTPTTDTTSVAPQRVSRKVEPVAPIPLPVTPEGAFRATVMAETGDTSAVVDRAWITYGSTWGDTQFTITALDGNGVPMPTGIQKGTVPNNRRAVLELPSGCVMATIEGHTAGIPAAALVVQPK